MEDITIKNIWYAVCATILAVFLSCAGCEILTQDGQSKRFAAKEETIRAAIAAGKTPLEINCIRQGAKC